jgi:AraC-like DNA-binding protein
VLNARAAETRFLLARHAASPALAPFVDYHWTVRWDLRGRPPHQQGVLAHPCVHLVFQEGGSAVFGVVPGLFSHRLQGAGRVVGVRFRPGGFRPFLRSPVSAITGRRLIIEEAFGADAGPVERAVLDAADEPAVDRFLRAVAPAPDPTVEAVAGMVASIAADPAVTRVGDLAARLGVGARSLQRLFAEYVGVGPKWVIRRCRLQEAAERAAGGAVDWSRLAADLGYFDQAHLIRDFTATVGASPARYARACALPGG